MIFSRKKQLIASITITFNGVTLTKVREAKFLGIILTDDLKWNKQVDIVVRKTFKVLCIRYRASHILDQRFSTCGRWATGGPRTPAWWLATKGYSFTF